MNLSWSNWISSLDIKFSHKNSKFSTILLPVSMIKFKWITQDFTRKRSLPKTVRSLNPYSWSFLDTETTIETTTAFNGSLILWWDYSLIVLTNVLLFFFKKSIGKLAKCMLWNISILPEGVLIFLSRDICFCTSTLRRCIRTSHDGTDITLKLSPPLFEGSEYVKMTL